MNFRIFSAIIFVFCLNINGQNNHNSPQNSTKYNLDSIQSSSVVFNKDTLFYVYSTKGEYPSLLRATEIENKFDQIEKNYNKLLDSIYLDNTNGIYKAMMNDLTVFITTDSDAKYLQVSIQELANKRQSQFIKALEKQNTLTAKEWAKRIVFFIVSLIGLLVFIKFINWLFKRLNKRLAKIEKSFLKKNKNILKYFIPKKTANIFVFFSKVIRIGIIGISLIVFAPFMFSFFPWAEHIVQLFYGYIETPVKYVAYGIIDFIPSLFFIIIIEYVARYIVRVMKEIAADVEQGKFVINNFHKDWAKPTEKIFSLLVYAMALVMIFPYLPGSGSTAFQGVSIFIGAIISFGSTSAIANIIAGIVITYMRPFQIGDRVKIDNIVGDVIGKTILVTQLKTSKMEDVTIPNANILIGNIINYTKNSEDSIILHTTITLGYDLPWKTANKLLIKAALLTQFVDKKPTPFVLQTSLDDFYVSYEINIHTKESKKIPFIYSELHKHILEVFNEAGVEILSPHYMAARDGSLTTVPGQLKETDKTPIQRIADHLTGRNQKVIISKGDDSIK